MARSRSPRRRGHRQPEPGRQLAPDALQHGRFLDQRHKSHRVLEVLVVEQLPRTPAEASDSRTSCVVQPNALRTGEGCRGRPRPRRHAAGVVAVIVRTAFMPIRPVAAPVPSAADR